jgi:voltage-gated potassium channel
MSWRQQGPFSAQSAPTRIPDLIPTWIPQKCGDTLIQTLLGRPKRTDSDVTKIDERIRDHVIICGFGGYAHAVLKHLGPTPPVIVFVERDRELETPLRQMGRPYVLGCATDLTVLERAGVRRARVLVAGTGDEATNISIVMAARELNPEIEIHARAESPEGVRHLCGAGATEVVSPYRLAARAIVRDLTSGPKPG